jgi:preprotein translocase subunit SecE
MAKINPIQYLREVKRETSKVTWPTRKETMITTMMVFIMAAIMSVFFLLVDQGLALAIKAILGLGG